MSLHQPAKRPDVSDPFDLTIPQPVRDIIAKGGLLAINHSGGKDSMAMTIALLRAGLPRDQIVIVHAHLPEVEWPDTIAHIKKTTDGLPIIIAQARKTFFEMVAHRRMFPSPQYRQCTSDLKRGPIERELRRYLKENPRFNGQIVSAIGIRAQESQRRAKQSALQKSQANCRAGRTWINWMPIHQFTNTDVFSLIKSAGQDLHWAYGKGMTRLSCCFCIMSSQRDLQCAAHLRPDLFKKYVQLEKDIGHTLRPDCRPLDEVICPKR